jgi:hypothetical protein
VPLCCWGWTPKVLPFSWTSLAVPDLETELLDIVRAAVKASLDLAQRRGNVIGYALCTDDGLGTLFDAVLTDEAFSEMGDPDLLFTANDWPEGECEDFFREANLYLQEKLASEPFEEHVDRRFATLVEALAEIRSQGRMSEKAFLTALSTDPSEYLEELEDRAVEGLNGASVLSARRTFLEKWG